MASAPKCMEWSTCRCVCVRVCSTPCCASIPHNNKGSEGHGLAKRLRMRVGGVGRGEAGFSRHRCTSCRHSPRAADHRCRGRRPPCAGAGQLPEGVGDVHRRVHVAGGAVSRRRCRAPHAAPTGSTERRVAAACGLPPAAPAPAWQRPTSRPPLCPSRHPLPQHLRQREGGQLPPVPAEDAGPAHLLLTLQVGPGACTPTGACLPAWLAIVVLLCAKVARCVTGEWNQCSPAAAPRASPCRRATAAGRLAAAAASGDRRIGDRMQAPSLPHLPVITSLALTCPLLTPGHAVRRLPVCTVRRECGGGGGQQG